MDIFHILFLSSLFMLIKGCNVYDGSPRTHPSPPVYPHSVDDMLVVFQKTTKKKKQISARFNVFTHTHTHTHTHAHTHTRAHTHTHTSGGIRVAVTPAFCRPSSSRRRWYCSITKRKKKIKKKLNLSKLDDHFDY